MTIFKYDINSLHHQLFFFLHPFCGDFLFPPRHSPITNHQPSQADLAHARSLGRWSSDWLFFRDPYNGLWLIPIYKYATLKMTCKEATRFQQVTSQVAHFHTLVAPLQCGLHPAGASFNVNHIIKTVWTLSNVLHPHKIISRWHHWLNA